MFRLMVGERSKLLLRKRLSIVRGVGFRARGGVRQGVCVFGSAISRFGGSIHGTWGRSFS